jgi:hypothetical protein
MLGVGLRKGPRLHEASIGARPSVGFPQSGECVVNGLTEGNYRRHTKVGS